MDKRNAYLVVCSAVIVLALGYLGYKMFIPAPDQETTGAPPPQQRAAKEMLACDACGFHDEFDRQGPEWAAVKTQGEIVCPKCGAKKLAPAVTCPRDGTVYVLNDFEKHELRTCPKCGYNEADRFRDSIKPRGR